MVAYMQVKGRLADLMADEADGGNNPQDNAELHRLLESEHVADRDQMMRIASLTQLAFLRRDRAAQAVLPATVRAKLFRQADAWSLAAGLAASGVRAGRDALINQAADVICAPWSGSAVSGYEQVSGDVVWSSERQKGYLQLCGLPANNRSRNQYQLWIADANRDGDPVSGGVFDVTQDGEMIIPVDPAQPVCRPTAFAVTLERPGGVVASDGPVLLVAAVGG